jgi:hypothetical protein
MSEAPKPIALPFGWRRREAPINVHRGLLELFDGGERVAAGDGQVFFRWLPRPGVAFVIRDQQLMGTVGPTTLRPTGLDVEASVLLTGSDPSGGDVSGVINRAPFAATEQISELRFLVPNYLFLRRGRVLEVPRARRRHVYSGRWRLESDDWELTLDERVDAETVRKRLKAKGGHEVTHTAALRRRDGVPFGDSVARDMLLGLAHFLGLTRGAWAPPLLAVGYDRRRRIVWRDWSPATTTGWLEAMNVIDVFHPESLDEAFAGFLRTWHDDIWREPLLLATQMYVAANGPVFAETALVLLQAALELLAWVRIVDDEASMTGPEFDKIEYRAAGRIRKLLDWLSVPPGIPPMLHALAAEANKLAWADGPHAIDAMRNALVHPDKRYRIEGTDLNARIDLQELALWYVELALLRVIGFDGDYSSRLGSRTTGTVEPVPWH